jgi:hypothetical protein
MQQDNSLLTAALKNERVSKNINVIAEKLCNNRRAQKEVCISSGKANIKRTRISAIKTY